jgi:hypothetical protein
LCAWKALSSFLREDTGGDALPAAIISIQTAGEFLNWHLHLHVLALLLADYKTGMEGKTPALIAGEITPRSMKFTCSIAR